MNSIARIPTQSFTEGSDDKASRKQRDRCLLRGMLCALVALVGGNAEAQGNPGEILFSSKISQTAGGFQGSLVNGQTFGEVAVIGDLDSDGVDELAVGARGDGVADSVFLLFMNADGTVDHEVELGDGQGGFPSGQLEIDDRWGSLAAIGDLDGDGVTELAVGAQSDNDGSTGTGALWILFLSAAGTVKASPPPQLFSATSGGLTGLDPFGAFGVAVEPVGDLDQNGVPDLAVGAWRDDLGQAVSFVGAVWFLFLDYSGGVVSVIGQSKISKSTPQLSAALGSHDFFGAFLAWMDPIQGAPVLAVSAHGDDDTGADEGAIYLLRLSISGTTVGVLSYIKIVEGVPGFSGPLDGDTDFPFGLTNIGDVDGNGTSDLGVGAPNDPNGGTGRGAVWVLRMNADGSVLGQRKISVALDDGDRFGSEIACLGDPDSDGRMTIAVGTNFDDDGGANRGAVYLLALNDGSLSLGFFQSTWRGDAAFGSQSDWTNSLNWNGGLVPSPSSTVFIPNTAVKPVIPLGTAASCLHLFIRTGASVTLGSPTSSLSIHGGATFQGPVLGTGPVTFVGAGTLAGASSIAVTGAVTATADITVQGGPLIVASGTTLTVNQDLTIDAGGELECDGTLSLASGTGGTLSGGGTLDCDGPVTLNVLSTSPPRLELSSSVSVNGMRFDPGSGEVVFDGAGLQTVSQTGGAIPFEFADLELAPGSDVLFNGDLVVHGDTDWSGDGESTGSILFEGDVTGQVTGLLALSAGGSTVAMTAGGNIEARGAVFGPGKMVLDPGGVTRLNTAGGLVVDLDHSIQGSVEVVGDGTLTIAGGDFGMTGDLSILDANVVSEGNLDLTVLGTILIAAPSQLDVQANHFNVFGDPAIDVLGDLLVGAGGELGLSVCDVDVGSTGLLRIVGTDEAPATIQEADTTTGGYTVEIQLNGALEARDFLVQRPGLEGLKIVDAATSLSAPLDLREGRFNLPAAVANARLLDIQTSSDIDLFELAFTGGLPGTNYNVRVPGTSQLVRIFDWTGGFAGPDFEFPSDDFAEWGTTLAYLIVHEQPGVNTVVWKTIRQGEVDKYVLERATGGGAFVPFTEVTPAALPQIYAVPDATITPATRYRYRLSERFPNLAVRELGILRTDGVPNPPGRRGSIPPQVAPLQAAGGGVSGPTGVFDSIQEALDAASGNGPIELSIAAGTYAAFEVRGRSVRLVSAEEGEVVIDASASPVRIHGLDAGTSVELAGLVLTTPSAGRPALVVEDCRGPVLLERVEAPEVMLENARAVVLEECLLTSLRMDGASRGFAPACELGSVSLANSSRLASWGWNGLLQRDSSSSWTDRGPRAPTLALESPDRGTLSATLAAQPGERWWLLASQSLGLGRAYGGLPLLLDAPFLLGAGARLVDPRGMGQRTVSRPAALIGLPLHVQALILDPKSGRVSLSNVERTRQR